MGYYFNRLIKPLKYSILVVLFLFLGQVPSIAHEPGPSQAIFIVK
jgi:hypothetical protein